VSTEAVTVVCGTSEAECVCVEMPDHDGAHVCKCGGSWSLDADGTFHMHALPFRLPEDGDSE
jgi:hypothetical protein